MLTTWLWVSWQNFFFPFFTTIQQEHHRQAWQHSPALLPSGLAAARAGKSCILATRVVFPKTPSKHAVLVALLAEAFHNLEMKSMNFWASCDVKFTHVPGLQRCTAATFILRIGLWNQCICAHNVFSGCGEKFMLTFNSGKSSLNFKTTFRNFEGMFNLWPGFQPRSPATATRACLWLMSFTWHFQPLVRSQTAGSAGRPPLPLLYIWMRGLSAVALQAGNGQRWVGAAVGVGHPWQCPAQLLFC